VTNIARVNLARPTVKIFAAIHTGIETIIQTIKSPRTNAAPATRN
jgi:hypothetical protein